MRCKYGFYTCQFKSLVSFCSECEDGSIYQFNDMAKAKKKIEGRGGPNRGQGRKPKYEGKTVAIRVPEIALPEIEAILKKYEKK